MPQDGCGVFRMASPETYEEAAAQAIQTGDSLIDAAADGVRKE